MTFYFKSNKENIRRRILVSEVAEPIRFSDYVEKNFPELPSRKAIKKHIKRSGFLLNDKIAHSGDWIENGMTISLLDFEKPISKVYECDVPVVFEDDHIAVVHKPAGLSVSGEYFRTLQNALPGILQNSSQDDAMAVPRPVHRLDNQTSGIVVVAKTYFASKALGEQFKQKTIAKHYEAILCGEAPDYMEMLSPVEDKKAHSELWLIKKVASLRYGIISYVRLRPHTGRTHQLRIHCASKDLSLYGDTLYGEDGNVVKGKGLFLVAKSISFIHPFTNEKLDFSVETPAKFESLLQKEQRRFDSHCQKD